MSETNHHINFSATDIERYWQGRLSPAEMHALEKAAMDDPFLADALEGFRIEKTADTGVAASVHETHIKDLEERLRARVEEKKSRVLPIGAWWKIAASVIVVGGSIWLFRFLNGNQSPERNIAA
ncbi:MAG: hypothetical protein JST39_06870 [Bacteroidetes bacterium]|nr:hypothetical protein [Bacteroidota bacterium]